LKILMPIIFIPSHSTCFYNIFETLLCECIKEVYNISIIFNTKTKKIQALIRCLLTLFNLNVHNHLTMLSPNVFL